MDLLPDLVAEPFSGHKTLQKSPENFHRSCVRGEKPYTQYVLEEIHQASTVNISLNVLKT